MSIFLFLIVLVVLILVHELGHFAVAKFFGIRVDEFGLGFPPKLFGKKFGETEYTINALPLGGFVRIWGEDPTQEHIDGPDSERSFVHKPKYAQALVLVAGVTMNVLLAWLLFSVGFMVGMPTQFGEEEVQQGADAQLLVTNVLPESPAAGALNPSDEILAVSVGEQTIQANDRALLPSEVMDVVSGSGNQEVTFRVARHGETVDVTVVPQMGIIEDEPNRAAAGFTMALAGTVQLPIHQALYQGGVMTVTMLRDVVVGLVSLASQAVQGEADLSQVSGPVGIVGLVGDAAALGFIYLITFSAFISLNLAVINLLPFPALDGGRLVFVAIESVTRRPIRPAVANTLNQVGFVLLLLLMVIVTWNDVARLL